MFFLCQHLILDHDYIALQILYLELDFSYPNPKKTAISFDDDFVFKIYTSAFLMQQDVALAVALSKPSSHMSR